MLYNASSFRQNPASVSGYQIQLFVGCGETGLGDEAGATNFGFQSGSGRFFVQSPQFEITGLEFEGKNLLQQPTGDDRVLMRDFLPLNDVINLKCFFSGDLNGITGLATRNIKFLSVFTGKEVTFTPDITGEKNLIDKIEAQVNEDITDFTINITSGQIEGRTEENIAYKVIPQDFLNFGNVSDGVSGKMFGGFEDFPSIESSPVTISRENINDIRFSIALEPVDIFANPCIILIDSGIAKDFNAQFRARHNGIIAISGINGAQVRTDQESLSQVTQQVRLGGDFFTQVTLNGIENSVFTIQSLLNADRNRESFLVTQ